MESQCPSCSRTIIYGAKVCKSCQCDIEYCSYCKEPNLINFKNCCHCGKTKLNLFSRTSLKTFQFSKNLNEFSNQEISFDKNFKYVYLWIIIPISLISSCFYFFYADELFLKMYSYLFHLADSNTMINYYKDRDSLLFYWPLFWLSFVFILIIQPSKKMGLFMLWLVGAIFACIVIVGYIVGGWYSISSKIVSSIFVLLALVYFGSRPIHFFKIIIFFALINGLLILPTVILTIIIGDMDSIPINEYILTTAFLSINFIPIKKFIIDNIKMKRFAFFPQFINDIFYLKSE